MMVQLNKKHSLETKIHLSRLVEHTACYLKGPVIQGDFFHNFVSMSEDARKISYRVTGP